MNKGRNNARRPVVFVADDARVVTTSELRELYGIAGDQRTVAEALGVSVSTICRALGGYSPAGKASRDERLAAVKEALGD
jgi:Trp operon repressor